MYFVVQDGGAVPRALVRNDHRGVQHLVGQGTWVESDLMVHPEPGWTVAEVKAHEFYDHVAAAMRAARAGLPCLALFYSTIGVTEVRDATMLKAVMRRRDGVEEWLDEDNVWRAEHRDLDGEDWLPISEEELEHLKWEAARPAFFAVHDDRSYPYAVVRTIPSAEEAFTRDLRWRPSDLLGRTDLRVEAVKCWRDAMDLQATIETGVRDER
jgi:hypothetical protein